MPGPVPPARNEAGNAQADPSARQPDPSLRHFGQNSAAHDRECKQRHTARSNGARESFLPPAAARPCPSNIPSPPKPSTRSPASAETTQPDFHQNANVTGPSVPTMSSPRYPIPLRRTQPRSAPGNTNGRRYIHSDIITTRGRCPGRARSNACETSPRMSGTMPVTNWTRCSAVSSLMTSNRCSLSARELRNSA